MTQIPSEIDSPPSFKINVTKQHIQMRASATGRYCFIGRVRNAKKLSRFYISILILDTYVVRTHIPFTYVIKWYLEFRLKLQLQIPRHQDSKKGHHTYFWASAILPFQFFNFQIIPYSSYSLQNWFQSYSSTEYLN